MFPHGLQARARLIAESLVGPLARRGITPNVITLAGFVFNVVTAGVIAKGYLTIGGCLLFLAGLFDMLDGALARVTTRQTTFGAFLDSLLDRYSEAAILLALIFQFTENQDTLAVILGYVVAVGSILISYARARAESLGLDGKVGIAPRPERVLILGVGLLFQERGTVVALLVLALLTHTTAMQRLYSVWRQTNNQTEDGPPKPRGAAETSAS